MNPLDRIYHERAWASEWERTRNPEYAPDLDDEVPAGLFGSGDPADGLDDTCGICRLPLDDHWLASCPDVTLPCADCQQPHTVSRIAHDLAQGEGFDHVCDTCGEKRLRAEEDAAVAYSDRDYCDRERGT